MRDYLIYYQKGAKIYGRIIKLDMVSMSSDDCGKLQEQFAVEAGAGKSGEYALMAPLWPHCATPNGVRYKEELSGPDGMSFMLIATPDITPADISQAKAELRAKRDVTKITTLRINEMI